MSSIKAGIGNYIKEKGIEFTLGELISYMESVRDPSSAFRQLTEDFDRALKAYKKCN